MKRILVLLMMSAGMGSAWATLQPGASAPDFTTQATLAGKPFQFAMADALKKGPTLADRTSYVISPEGKILYSYSAMNPDQHVANTLAAVKKWAADRPH